MKHYKDSQNKIFAYELDGSQDHLIPFEYVAITNEEVAAIIATEQAAAFDALTYTQKRASEYPPITDYLDGIVKGDHEQIAKYIADCQAVKTKYPK